MIIVTKSIYNCGTCMEDIRANQVKTLDFIRKLLCLVTVPITPMNDFTRLEVSRSFLDPLLPAPFDKSLEDSPFFIGCNS